MNRIPADFDVSQIPQKYRENISNFLTKGKQQYADAAMAIGDYEVGSDGYIAHVATMNKVKNSFHNLKSQFDQFGAGKKDLTQDMLEGMYSKGNDPDEISLLTSVYTDELDVNIGEDGNIGFMGGDGNITNLGDLPDYFNKDYQNGDAIQNMANSIYKAGNPLNSSTSLMYENKLYSMIEKGGLSTLKSLARDDFFNRGGIPSITDEELNDPMQRDAVEKKLVDYYMGVFKTHASNGVSAKKTTSNKTLKLSPKVNKWVSDNEGADLKVEDWMANVFAGTKYYLEAAYASADDDAEIKGYYIVKEGRRSGEGLTYVPDLSTSTLGPIIEKLKI
jgi:hypothetical protein